MGKKDGQKGRFKSKGESILKGPSVGPKSIKEFLSPPEELTSSAQLHNDSFVQRRNGTLAQNHSCTLSDQTSIHSDETSVNDKQADLAAEEISRLHVHIRKDLADKLMEAVFIRKRDRSFQRKDATQRFIIEQALETWFEEHPVKSMGG